MTKRHRAQVVELLRCAADAGMDGETPVGLLSAGDEFSVEVNDLAWDAYYSVRTEEPGRFRLELLEAAARVEEGSWP